MVPQPKDFADFYRQMKWFCGMVTAAPSPEEKRRARLVGTTGLTLGLGLFALIVYAVLR